jgi:hypothetical protein
MAMTKCSECGARVSNKAQACPQCGAPVKKAKKKGCGCQGAILLAIIIGAVVWLANSSDDGPAEKSSKPPVQSNTKAKTHTPKTGPKEDAAKKVFLNSIDREYKKLTDMAQAVTAQDRLSDYRRGLAGQLQDRKYEEIAAQLTQILRMSELSHIHRAVEGDLKPISKLVALQDRLREIVSANVGKPARYHGISAVIKGIEGDVVTFSVGEPEPLQKMRALDIKSLLALASSSRDDECLALLHIADGNEGNAQSYIERSSDRSSIDRLKRMRRGGVSPKEDELKPTPSIGEAVSLLDKFARYGALGHKDVKDINLRIRTSQCKRRLRQLSESDLKGRADTYLELAKLHPTNAEYARESKRYRDRFDQQQAELRKAKLLAEQRQRAAAQRKERIEAQFSGWDGSHRNLEKIIKKSMHNPDSYKHTETVYWDRGDHLVVKTTYRGTNAFGGVVTNWTMARVDLDGTVTEIVGQGP